MDTNIICLKCNYHKAIKELHHVSGELFINCPRCGYWRQYLDKKGSSPNVKDTNSFIKETEDYYIVGGGGKGAFRIESGKDMIQIGSLDKNNRDAFEYKVREMLQFKKVNKVFYTEKQLGVWFEFDVINNTKREIKDDE